MALVFYTKVIGGARFPKASRTDPRVAFCHEVTREGSKVRTRYLGIKRAPEDTQIQVKSNGDAVEKQLSTGKGLYGIRNSETGKFLRDCKDFPTKEMKSLKAHWKV